MGYAGRRRRRATLNPSYGASPSVGRAHAFLPAACVLILAGVAPLRAAELDVSSAIDAVTVYPDGATVTRLIAVDLPQGDTTLIARDFPPGLDVSSLRVEGGGGASITIGAIDARAERRGAAAAAGAAMPGVSLALRAGRRRVCGRVRARRLSRPVTDGLRPPPLSGRLDPVAERRGRVRSHRRRSPRRAAMVSTR